MKGYLFIAVVLSCIILSSCSTQSVPVATPSIEPSISTPLSSETPLIDSSTDSELIKQEVFMKDLIEAINNSNVVFINENIIHSYGMDIFDKIYEGFVLYNYIFEGEKITKFEYVSEPAFPDYIFLYKLITETGKARCILLEKTPDTKYGYMFIDSLFSEGKSIVSRTESYFNAIKTKDIKYFYDYLVMIYENSEAGNFEDQNHNKEYEKLAKNLISRYEQEFNLDTIQLKLISIENSTDRYSALLLLEYSITGLTPDNEPKEHTITGIYEMPIIGVLDTWFEHQ